MNPWQQGQPGQNWGAPQQPQAGPYGQPSFGAPQYGTPQYGATDPYAAPQYGLPGPGFTPQPSGATGIAAAVLSLLGGAAQLFGAFSAIGVSALLSSASSSVGEVLPGWYSGVLMLTIVIGFALAAALLVGGGFLLARRSWARILIAATCGITIALGILSLIVSNAVYQNLAGEYASGQGVSSIFSILGLIFPVVTAVLALLPGTKAWCQASGR